MMRVKNYYHSFERATRKEGVSTLTIKTKLGANPTQPYHNSFWQDWVSTHSSHFVIICKFFKAKVSRVTLYLNEF
jgi:hypothetical protein